MSTSTLVNQIKWKILGLYEEINNTDIDMKTTMKSVGIWSTEKKLSHYVGYA